MPAPTFDFDLFGTPGTSGYHARKSDLVAKVNEVIAKLYGQQSRIFPSREAAVSETQAGLPASVGRIITTEGTALVLRGPGQTENDPLFGSYPNWGVISKQDTSTVLRDAALLQLTNVTGSANFPVASLKPALYNLDAPITLDTYFSIIPVLTNTDRVYLTVGSVIASTEVLNNAGQSLVAGDWVAGRSYLLTRRGNHFRIVAGDLVSSEVRGGRSFVILAADSPSGYNVPTSYSADLVTTVQYSSMSFRNWRRIVAPSDGRETDTVKKDANDIWWQLLTERGLIDEVVARSSADEAIISDYSGKFRNLQDPSLRDDEGLALLTGPKQDGTDDLIRVYQDGLDFIPSQRLIGRLGGGSGGGSGGGLTEDGWATAPDGSFTAQAGQHGIQAVDRFLIRGDGVRLPVPVVGGVQRRASIESSFGQSNANVTRLQDGLIWDTPPLPHHAFMLDDMNAFGSGTHRGGMMGWQGVAVARGTRFISASEALRATQDFSSAAFATRQRLAGSGLRRVGLIRSSAWGGNKLVGNAAGQGIWKDSNGAYTQAWINWQGDLLQSYQLLTAAGYLVDQVNINFVHQEADWQTPRATYLSDFIAMKGEIQTWIAANLPGVSVEWFVDQASGSGRRTPTYNGGAWPVRMSIHDASLPANGGNNITMVMPRYWLTFGSTMGGAQEDIHHSYRARIWQGEIYGYAQREKRAGRPWRCPVMSSASVNGNSVVVDFNSLLPLVIDPTFCKVRSDMGFVIGNGAAVTGVRQTGQRQITVDCATAPGTSISYAYRSVDGADVQDEWPIATGAIRDAWEAPSAFDPGKKLVRAALGYQLQL